MKLRFVLVLGMVSFTTLPLGAWAEPSVWSCIAVCSTNGKTVKSKASNQAQAEAKLTRACSGPLKEQRCRKISDEEQEETRRNSPVTDEAISAR